MMLQNIRALIKYEDTSHFIGLHAAMPWNRFCMMYVFEVNMSVPFVLARGWGRYRVFVAVYFSVILMAVIR